MGIAKAAVHDENGKVAVEKLAAIVGKLHKTASILSCMESIFDGKDAVHANAKATDRKGNFRFIDNRTSLPEASGIGVEHCVVVNGNVVDIYTPYEL